MINVHNTSYLILILFAYHIISQIQSIKKFYFTCLDWDSIFQSMWAY